MDPGIRGYEIVDFDTLPAVACPCGYARRAFLDVADFPGTIHRTEITANAQKHTSTASSPRPITFSSVKPTPRWLWTERPFPSGRACAS